MSSEEDNRDGDEDMSGLEDEEEAGGGIPAEVELNDRYMELIADPYVRTVVAMVVRNPNSGDISGTKTRHSLRKWFKDESIFKHGVASFEPHRMRILSFLNNVWFTGCDDLSTEFWWVNRDNILSLCYVAVITTGFGMGESKGSPEVTDMPKSAMHIYDYIERECQPKAFAELDEDFAAMCKENEDFSHVFTKCLKNEK